MIVGAAVFLRHGINPEHLGTVALGAEQPLGKIGLLLALVGILFAVGGASIDAQWSDDFHHALHSVIAGERNGYYSDFGSMRDLATALETSYVYTGRRSKFRLRRPAGRRSA